MKAVRKRQRTAALHDAIANFGGRAARERRGVRLSSAAFKQTTDARMSDETSLTEAELRTQMMCEAKMDQIKIKLVIAYDGTNYEGWQTQKTGTGVQQKIEEALAKLFPSQPKLHSSSRTDTGVHALGMVAHFEAPAGELKRMGGRKLSLALNAWLAEDIRIFSAAPARPDFHAR